MLCDEELVDVILRLFDGAAAEHDLAGKRHFDGSVPGDSRPHLEGFHAVDLDQDEVIRSKNQGRLGRVKERLDHIGRAGRRCLVLQERGRSEGLCGGQADRPEQEEENAQVFHASPFFEAGRSPYL